MVMIEIKPFAIYNDIFMPVYFTVCKAENELFTAVAHIL